MLEEVEFLRCGGQCLGWSVESLCQPRSISIKSWAQLFVDFVELDHHRGRPSDYKAWGSWQCLYSLSLSEKLPSPTVSSIPIFVVDTLPVVCFFPLQFSHLSTLSTLSTLSLSLSLFSLSLSLSFLYLSLIYSLFLCLVWKQKTRSNKNVHSPVFDECLCSKKKKYGVRTKCTHPTLTSVFVSRNKKIWNKNNI